MKLNLAIALLAVASAVACCKNESPTNPTQTCTYTASSTSQSPSASGGPFSVTLTRTAGSCTWAASSNASWVTFTGPSSGSDTATLGVAVASNPTSQARAATITVTWSGGTAQIAVNQSGLAFGDCVYAFANASQNIGPEGGPSLAPLAVTGNGCSWTASVDAAWLTITSNQSGTASASIGFTAAANPDVGTRAGTITATSPGGQTARVTITQSGITACTYTLSPTSQNVTAAGGSFSITPTRNTPNGCAWQASTDTPWITLTGPTSGLSTVPITYNVGANGTGSARAGRITVVWSGGNTDFIVNQTP
jgi:hypothetical protein